MNFETPQTKELADQLSGEFSGELSKAMNEKSSDNHVFLKDVYFSMIEMIQNHSSNSLLDMGIYHFSKPGKMIRSQLIYNLAKIYNIPYSLILNWAISCELLHEASLIHDDLQDGDTTRRDQDTIWYKFGSAQAINLGDFLLMLSYRPLSELPQKLTTLHCLTALKLVQGQSDETETKLLIQNFTENYISCVRGKTGALFSSLASGVGHLSPCQNEELDLIENVFAEIGIIFQIQDDLLDLFGDKKRGFQGSDIQEGKYSILVSQHFDLYPEDQLEIKKILLKPRSETSFKDIQTIRELFLNKDTFVKCLEFLDHRIQQLKLKLKSNSSSVNPKFETHVESVLNQILEPINTFQIENLK